MVNPAPNATRPPGYWQNETSGVLKPAVMAYLENKPMTLMHIAAMRAYLKQWVNSDAWDQNPYANDATRSRLAELRRLANYIQTQGDIRAWISIAVDEGMDPL